MDVFVRVYVSSLSHLFLPQMSSEMSLCQAGMSSSVPSYSPFFNPHSYFLFSLLVFKDMVREPTRFHFLKLIFIGVQLLYSVVLVSAVQQSEDIRIHISPPFWISFPFRSPRSNESSSLSCTADSHSLPTLYIVSVV